MRSCRWLSVIVIVIYFSHCQQITDRKLTEMQRYRPYNIIICIGYGPSWADLLFFKQKKTNSG